MSSAARPARPSTRGPAWAAPLLGLGIALAACGTEDGAGADASTSDAAIDAAIDGEGEGAPRDAAEAPDVSADAADSTADTSRAGADATAPPGPNDTTTGDDVEQRVGCNGHPELCERRYDEVVFPATHNSMSNAADGWLAPNQNLPMSQQLADGVRAFLIDTYVWKDGTYLCHGICEAGSRPLAEAAAELAAFLDAHPGEVITLLIEDYVDAATTAEVFEQAGLARFAFTPEAGAPWPTLGELVAQDRRLVVTAQTDGPPPAWYLHMWEWVSDTPYSFATLDALAPEAGSCAVNRGDGDNDLFLLNHWLSTPLGTFDGAQLANERDVLLSRARACELERGRLPNFVAVDFYDTGALFEVVDILNGLAPED